MFIVLTQHLFFHLLISTNALFETLEELLNSSGFLSTFVKRLNCQMLVALFYNAVQQSLPILGCGWSRWIRDSGRVRILLLPPCLNGLHGDLVGILEFLRLIVLGHITPVHGVLLFLGPMQCATSTFNALNKTSIWHASPTCLFSPSNQLTQEGLLCVCPAIGGTQWVTDDGASPFWICPCEIHLASSHLNFKRTPAV